MSGIMEQILGRRSIRKYTAEPVLDEDLVQLLQAAMAAPSASNRRPWEFVVVTDVEVLNGLRRDLVFGRYRAPAAIVVCGDMRRTYPGFARTFWIQDCSAATQNILLAAHGLGLGTVWIGVHPVGPLMTFVSRTVGLPKHVVPLNVIYVGHPAEAKEPRTQYDAGRVSWQRYGSH
ncbi:MAG: nitroreductase family protein [Anaerolineae bacterium]